MACMLGIHPVGVPQPSLRSHSMGQATGEPVSGHILHSSLGMPVIPQVHVRRHRQPSHPYLPTPRRPSHPHIPTPRSPRASSMTDQGRSQSTFATHEPRLPTPRRAPVSPPRHNECTWQSIHQSHPRLPTPIRPHVSLPDHSHHSHSPPRHHSHPAPIAPSAPSPGPRHVHFHPTPPPASSNRSYPNSPAPVQPGITSVPLPDPHHPQPRRPAPAPPSIPNPVRPDPSPSHHYQERGHSQPTNTGANTNGPSAVIPVNDDPDVLASSFLPHPDSLRPGASEAPSVNVAFSGQDRSSAPPTQGHSQRTSPSSHHERIPEINVISPTNASSRTQTPSSVLPTPRAPRRSPRPLPPDVEPPSSSNYSSRISDVSSESYISTGSDYDYFTGNRRVQSAPRYFVSHSPAYRAYHNTRVWFVPDSADKHDTNGHCRVNTAAFLKFQYPDDSYASRGSRLICYTYYTYHTRNGSPCWYATI